jgi:hypothetical protein
MRIWSIHPKYLDAKGIVALWREALLAQAVLSGKTRGYRNHPQLDRFKKNPDPLGSIGKYLKFVLDESRNRGYAFSAAKIIRINDLVSIPVNSMQVEYEFRHLLKKLSIRDANRYNKIIKTDKIITHPVFRVVPGGIEEWERTS